MKKIFVIAALAVMFTLTSCGCGNTKSADSVDSTAVEVVDSLSVNADTVVDAVTE